MAKPWEQLEGAKAFVDWFGRWPGFHDSEVVHLHLNRRGASSLVLYTFDGTNETDERGYYKLIKHVLVEFTLHEIEQLELHDFSQQNVLFGLSIESRDNGVALLLDPSYGVSGSVVAKRVAISFTPVDGRPQDV